VNEPLKSVQRKDAKNAKGAKEIGGGKNEDGGISIATAALFLHFHIAHFASNAFDILSVLSFAL
jgi:hypothetical protein